MTEPDGHFPHPRILPPKGLLASLLAQLPLLALAPVFLTGTLANLWAPIALFLWLHFAFVTREEAFLRDRLGAPYVEYAQRTPRWLGIPFAR